MRIQLLPTTFDQNGCSTQHQHLSCLVINDCVAVDAGSLAMATTPVQKENIRDVVLTHAHLDHIAGLPIFIDDLFATLETPIRIHAIQEVIDALENFIFNWTIYPRFSELQNKNGRVMSYQRFGTDKTFQIKGIDFKAIEVNHKVPTVGFILSEGKSKVAISGDTAEMSGFWAKLNRENYLSALLIECAFPNELDEIAQSSHHLTPERLILELEKFEQPNCPVFVTNIKPMYRDQVLTELSELKISNLKILEVGKIYEF